MTRTVDEVIAHVVAVIAERQPRWTPGEVRGLVEIGRDVIAYDPDAFVAAFDGNVARLEAVRATKGTEA